MDNALIRLTADGLTQPLLFAIQGRYYIKADNTAILLTDSGCFAEAAETLFMSFFIFSVSYPPQLSNFYYFFERLLKVDGCARKLFEFFRTLESL